MKQSLPLYFLMVVLAATLVQAERTDNTAINERDRGGRTLTAEDQGTSQSDRDISARIREALVKDDSLSTYAKNVKIITDSGKVTLRGPVRSDGERRVVEERAEKIAGVKAVENLLEIIKG